MKKEESNPGLLPAYNTSGKLIVFKKLIPPGGMKSFGPQLSKNITQNLLFNKTKKSNL